MLVGIKTKKNKQEVIMNYHDIKKVNMLNGDGLRVVLWVSGCNHYCKNCFNPETWDANSGLLFDENAMQEIREELSKGYCAGITFSGGDPLYPRNRKKIKEIISEIKKDYPDKNMWLYTGYKYEEIKDKINILKKFNNIIIKFGRYIPNSSKRYDDVLGIYLSSENQYALRLN